ncbi:MAG: large-conductance mechanosensitive channel protein MscL [Chitinophagia bacterium]|nr:large-conductance mechanosensitive channel protein MscL [Chitinophagia bacterium]
MSMIREFREFAVRGNLVDMAVAFVMGGAFGKVVTGFIDGIVMPLVGMITAGVDFKSLKYVLSDATLDATGNVVSSEVAIHYGEFITILIDFLLVSLVMFMLVKAINRMRKEQTPPTAEPSGPTEDQKLLAEIRDLLKK